MYADFETVAGPSGTDQGHASGERALAGTCANSETAARPSGIAQCLVSKGRRAPDAGTCANFEGAARPSGTARSLVFQGAPGTGAARKKIGTCVDFETAARPSGTDWGMMDPATKLPLSSPVSPSEPPSGIRFRAGRVAPGAPTLAHTLRECAPGEDTEGSDVAGFDERRFIEFVKAQTRPKRVEHYARALRVPSDRAEDILQSSLEKLLPLRAEIESATWEPWLWNAMRLRSLDYFRSVRRARRHEARITLLLRDWQSCASPEAALYQRECERELSALLDNLAPERREVVSLYLIDGLSMKDVAASLGIPFDTAKNRWRLAAIDMAGAWERGRAKERSKSAIAALLALVAIWVAFWRRLAHGAQRRRGPLLACAACAFVFATHEEPARAALSPEAAAVIVAAPGAPGAPGAPAAPDHLDAPPAEIHGVRPSDGEARAVGLPETSTVQARAPGSAVALAPSGHAAGQQVAATPQPPGAPGPSPRNALRIDAAHKHLAGVTELRQQGRIDGARKLLRLYRQVYRPDPLPQEHALVAASLATP